ncbi:MAG: hypothetical protein PGN24_05520 [Microbacterium arborescens]
MAMAIAPGACAVEVFRRDDAFCQRDDDRERMRDDVVQLAGDAVAFGGGRELSVLVPLDDELLGAFDQRRDVPLPVSDVRSDEGSERGHDGLADDRVQCDRRGDHAGEAQGQRGRAQGSERDAHPDDAGPVAPVDGEGVARDADQRAAHRDRGEEVGVSDDGGADEERDGEPAPEHHPAAAEDDRHDDDRGGVRPQGGESGLRPGAVAEGRRRDQGEQEADDRDERVGEDRMPRPEPSEDAGGTRQPQLVVVRRAAAARWRGRQLRRHVCEGPPSRR